MCRNISTELVVDGQRIDGGGQLFICGDRQGGDNGIEFCCQTLAFVLRQCDVGGRCYLVNHESPLLGFFSLKDGHRPKRFRVLLGGPLCRRCISSSPGPVHAGVPWRGIPPGRWSSIAWSYYLHPLDARRGQYLLRVVRDCGRYRGLEVPVRQPAYEIPVRCRRLLPLPLTPVVQC